MKRLILYSVVGCLVIAGCGGAREHSAEDTCRRHPSDEGRLRSAAPTNTRFTGDRYVSRLRWVAEHDIVEASGAVGTPRHGVVPVTGGSDPEPDYGVPTRHHMGVLRLRDGKVMWQRPGSFSRGGPASADVLTASTGQTGLSTFAAFDLETGRASACGLPRPARILGDGTAVGITPDRLTRVRLRDGASLWRSPVTARFQHAVTGDGVVVASTDPADPTRGLSASETVTQVSALRLEDGSPLWKITDRAEPGPDAVELPERTVLGIADERVVITDRRRLSGHRAADGKPLWSRPSPRWHDGATFTVVDSRLLIAAQGRVTAYRMADGTVDWTEPTPNPPILSASAASGGLLFAPISQRPGLAVIDLRRGRTAATLTGAVSDSWGRDVTIGDGVLVVQDRNRTMAFDLR
ncbi:putative pyrroloquinoline-quinone binding quinoprotein [Actinomadura pelletieri DSM 43383]|uniref:Putative pyrroloquinoline-quinone binding quinoprotein n=1 Tax=Actinomadura pelletieri DSM 43383 TaxID=1120940 RepID=A0A495QKS0_9ACTN|nr:PQQ-binding-like beta-propeller repeat protein [Actinomadura pelletieri]RKS73187.1 putative pyrroloquinoline-quinone binding quinoprotein [Actinomadura pelletieri DSM 43383]